MADETDPGLYKGEFSRQTQGQTLNRYLKNIGQSGRQFPPQNSAPSNPEDGDLYLADGSNWDPAGSGNAALVMYADGGWRTINEFTTAGGL